MERTGWRELPLCLLSMNTDTLRRACGEAACRLWPESVNLEVAADVLGALQLPCGGLVHKGWYSRSLERSSSRCLQEPHPQHRPAPPFSALGNRSCGRSQLPSRLSLSWQVSHQPPGCLPHPDAVSVSVSLRAATSTTSHTTVLGTETKACRLLAFRVPSSLAAVVGAEGSLWIW